ncbi:hypothetical protein HUU05_19715, partial [candidate division KSB1 bacterium]|nr:hypothetical protein [candidate division KSB1 bacterium]
MALILTLGEILRTLGEGARYAGDQAVLTRRATAVSIDSRACGAEALFVALRGDRFDGHNFIADVFAKQALEESHARESTVAFRPPVPAARSRLRRRREDGAGRDDRFRKGRCRAREGRGSHHPALAQHGRARHRPRCGHDRRPGLLLLVRIGPCRPGGDPRPGGRVRRRGHRQHDRRGRPRARLARDARGGRPHGPGHGGHDDRGTPGDAPRDRSNDRRDRRHGERGRDGRGVLRDRGHPDRAPGGPHRGGGDSRPGGGVRRAQRRILAARGGARHPPLVARLGAVEGRVGRDVRRPLVRRAAVRGGAHRRRGPAHRHGRRGAAGRDRRLHGPAAQRERARRRRPRDRRG